MQEIFPNDPELIVYIQRLLGYALSGYCTERVLPFWIGGGANGKSVLANIILGILGKLADGYGMEASFNSFIMGKFNDPDKPRNDIMRFEGKRFITASEKDDPTAKLDTELLKKISGNDDLSGRGNYSPDGTVQTAGQDIPAHEQHAESYRRHGLVLGQSQAHSVSAKVR